MESASTRSQRFWPADNEFISDGAKIRYLDTAEGSNTVLLIHGWSTSTLMWSNRKPFSTNIIDPLVSAGFRVVAMDCRGHGMSEKFYDDDDYGMKMVQDHLNLLDHLEVEAAHVAGASMGAEIAIKLAVTHPNRVKSLCPAGSGWSQGTSYYQDGYAAFSNPCTLYGFVIGCLRACWYPCCCPCWIRHILGEVPDCRALLVAAEAMHEVLEVSEDDLRSLQIPVHAIVGELDPEKIYLERMRDVVPDFSLTVIPGRNHDATFLDPLWSESTVEFIKRVGSDPT